MNKTGTSITGEEESRKMHDDQPIAGTLDPHAGREHYLNFASYGPPLPAVVDTVRNLWERAARGGPTASASLHAEDDRARVAVSRLTGGAPDRVALTGSTSQGLLQLAFGVRGEVLLSLDEFPANIEPWRRAEQAGRLRLRALPGSGGGGGLDAGTRVTPQRVADALSPAITAVSVSAVDFRTGYRADLAGIRRAIGPDRLLIVDAIQGFGMIESDWSAADAVAVGGQKWLRAGWGTGFVQYSELGMTLIEPALAGWTGVENPALYDGRPHRAVADAGRYSVTSASPFASGALATAAEQAAAGLATVERTLAVRVDALIAVIDAAGLPLLSPRDPRERAGIVVAGFPAGDAAAVHARLTASGITATLHGEHRIRFSPHVTTPPEAAAAAVAAVLRDAG